MTPSGVRENILESPSQPSCDYNVLKESELEHTYYIKNLWRKEKCLIAWLPRQVLSPSHLFQLVTDRSESKRKLLENVKNRVARNMVHEWGKGLVQKILDACRPYDNSGLSSEFA